MSCTVYVLQGVDTSSSSAFLCALCSLLLSASTRPLSSEPLFQPTGGKQQDRSFCALRCGTFACGNGLRRSLPPSCPKATFPRPRWSTPAALSLPSPSTPWTQQPHYCCPSTQGPVHADPLRLNSERCTGSLPLRLQRCARRVRPACTTNAKETISSPPHSTAPSSTQSTLPHP
jgi:hypothetical protein